MITRLPVATAEDHHNLFMAIDGVVGGMQGRGRAAAGRVSRRDSPRPGPDHTVEDDPGAGLMNTVTKYMVSRTLTKVDWNNSTLLEGELADLVRELKESDGGEITTSGSSTLVRALLDLKRLDELNLLGYRVISGAVSASPGATETSFLRNGSNPPPSTMGSATSSIGPPPERSRMFEQLDFIYQRSRDVSADVEYYRRALGAEFPFAVERLGTPVAMVRLTSDAPELLLTGHLEGEQAILILRVANLETAMREITEHRRQIGGRFEMRTQSALS